MHLTTGRVYTCFFLLDSLHLLYRYFICQQAESVFHPFISSIDNGKNNRYREGGGGGLHDFVT